MAIVALGLLNLYFPFVSDQICTIMGAQTLSRGGTLYVDFWDNKMPALYWFFWAAGELFGYTERGLHTLELIWMTGFAIVLAWALRPYFIHPWLSAVAPVAVIGAYYAAAEAIDLTQVEMLIAFPTFLSAWFASRLPQQRRKLALNFAAAGVFAGIAVAFKIVFAPVFFVFWVILSVRLRYSERLTWTAIFQCVWCPAGAGVGVVLGAIALKFWFDDALDELYWTAFVYPPQALDLASRAPFYRLAKSIIFFGSYYAAWSPLVVLGIIHWWRSDRDPLTSLFLAWLLARIFHKKRGQALSNPL